MAIDYFAQQFGKDVVEDTAPPPPDYRQMVLDAYGTIGRTGVGEAANQVDAAGADAWTKALETGQIKPEDWNATFQTAVTDYIATNPDDKYTQYVKDYQAKQAGTTGEKIETVDGGDINATSNVGDAATTGATTAAATPNYDQIVRDAYGSIGRTGIGSGASNIDQAGFDYWVNTLKSGASTPEAFGRNFQTAVADYLVTKPEDQYSTYVADYLTDTKPAAVSGIVDLYEDILGRAPDAGGLGHWLQQFGSEISSDERAQFEKAAKAELDSRTQDLYSEFMGSGRVADQGGLDYWRQRFGNEIDDSEREQFRQAAAFELSGAFGVGGAKALAGFKYAKDLGVSDDGLKATLGEDLYNQYKNQLKNTTTTSINDIIADNSLTFAESQTVANLARDLGYNSQQLADLTGKDKSLFDTILTNYDTSRTKIINDTLTGTNVSTDADRVLASYALEKQFGFSDEDISKATGVDVNVIKNSLAPVRNFETDFSKIANNTDSTTQQIKDFVATAKANGAVNKLYGEALTGYETKIAELETKWSSYGSDAIQSENLFQQLNAQKNALGGQYFKGVFGDLQNSAALLVKKGVDTLGDLGQKDKFTTSQVIENFFTADGQRVSKQGDEYYLTTTDSFGEPSSQKIDSSKVTKKYFKYEDDGQGNTDIKPLSEKELATVKDGTYQQKIGSVVIDKDNGAELTDTTGQLAFQKSGGVFTGKNHWLNANFTDDGTAYLTATTEKTGIYGFVDEMGPMVISIAAMIPGPHQPFAMMANAALAVSQKNYLGAVLSGLNAAGSFTGAELTAMTSAEAAGDIINTSRVLDLQNTASNIKLAQTAVSGFAALKADNIAGVINSSLSAYGQTGGTLPSGLTTAMQTANLALAIKDDNLSAALVSLGDITNSKDLYVAAAAKNLIDAFQSGNEVNIAKAGIAFGNAFQASNNAATTNIGALDGLTSSGRTGDDMGGSYDVIDGLKTAGLTENPETLASILGTTSGVDNLTNVDRTQSLYNYAIAQGKSPQEASLFASSGGEGGIDQAAFSASNQSLINQAVIANQNKDYAESDRLLNLAVNNEIALGDKGTFKPNGDGSYTNKDTNDVIRWNTKEGIWVVETAGSPSGVADGTKTGEGTVTSIGTGETGALSTVETSVDDVFLDKYGALFSIGTPPDVANKLTVIAGSGSSGNATQGLGIVSFDSDQQKQDAITWVELARDIINNDVNATEQDKIDFEKLAKKIDDTKVVSSEDKTTTEGLSSSTAGSSSSANLAASNVSNSDTTKSGLNSVSGDIVTSNTTGITGGPNTIDAGGTGPGGTGPGGTGPGGTGPGGTGPGGDGPGGDGPGGDGPGGDDDKKDDTVVTDDDEIIACPAGYKPSADGKSCVPIVKPPPPPPPPRPPPPPPKKCPTGYKNVNGVCVLIKKAVKPTEYRSGASGPGEKIDPIYAGAMDDFNLFATLEELVKGNPDKKKDTKKSKDKTKMATGGHLDDLLAEQMTVDDLLKLLR